MRIVSLTFARNEEDIIEEFVEHHRGVVDRMIVILHRSTDRTEEILHTLRERGLPIECRLESALEYRQKEALTNMLDALRDGDDDWILPLDTDEFLIAPVETTVRSVLQDLAPDVYNMPWKTYVPTPMDERGSPLRRRITFRRQYEPQQYTKVFFAGSVLRQRRCALGMGSHALEQIIDDRRIALPSHPSPLWLAHFPVRSADQIRRKVIQGWESLLAHPERRAGDCFQWEVLYERCKDPTPMTREELRAIAWQYASPPFAENAPLVQDPVPF